MIDDSVVIQSQPEVIVISDEDGAGAGDLNGGEVGVILNSSSSASSSATSSRKSNVHYLPCGIKYDGPTDVNSFFRISTDVSTGVLTSHLRGRELKGSHVVLPNNISGLCVTPGKDDPRQWEVTAEFDDMTLWEHDLTPDVAQMQEYLNYFAVAQAVHE